MIFKLVRTDSAQPQKIELKQGKHLIGRKNLVDCEDKRVSRHHGELTVTESAVVMIALHHNPCFYMKQGNKDVEILKQNSDIALGHGDRIGLLPDSYWYEIICCNDMEENLIDREANAIKENTIHDNVNPNKSNGTRLNLLSETISNESNNDETCSGDDGGIEDFRIAENPSTVERSDSPSLLSQNNEQIAHEEPEKSEVKRSLSIDESSTNTEVKKIKIEPVIKQEIDGVQAGPSNDLQDSSNEGNNNLPPSPVKPANVPQRERCIYGSSCYRKNPQHKVEFSHPSDPDWGAGPRGACPWGPRCRRRDPRHWQHHEHPPGTRPPPDRPGMQVVQRHGNTFYINAHTVNFYDDHFQVEDSDGDSVDYDYEF